MSSVEASGLCDCFCSSDYGTSSSGPWECRRGLRCHSSCCVRASKHRRARARPDSQILSTQILPESSQSHLAGASRHRADYSTRDVPGRNCCTVHWDRKLPRQSCRGTCTRHGCSPSMRSRYLAQSLVATVSRSPRSDALDS